VAYPSGTLAVTASAGGQTFTLTPAPSQEPALTRSQLRDVVRARASE
jgi:hypothetical protein